MPSSTSSSDRTRVLGLAGLILVTAVVCLEIVVRSQGIVPSVVDSKDLWSQVRSDVYGADKVALIGGSRSLLDMSPETFERLRPGLEMRQLSLGGTWGLAVLRDLAADPDFDGFVIASVRAEALEPVRWDAQQDYVDWYHREWGYNRGVSVRLRTALSERLALVSPAISLPRLTRWIVDERALPRQWLVFHGDRSVHADFTKWERVPDAMVRAVFAEEFERHPISPPDEWLAATAPVEAWIEQIQGRGGRVAVVRFPTSRSHWQVDEENYPRALYWNRFAARTAAVAIHFRDDPELAALPLPDATHLDYTMAPVFTERLVVLLDRQGFFDRAAR